MTRISKDAKKSKVYEISEIMEKFGTYQRVQFFYACLPAIVVTMINVNYIFVAGELNYRCFVPECESSESSVDRPQWWPDGVQDLRCYKPTVRTEFMHNDTCSNSSFNGEVTPCTQWIYESDDTVVAGLNLACQPWKSKLIGTVHSAGSLLSMVVVGWMADRFGRKPTLIICIIGGCIGHIKAFATSYYVYIAIEFLEAMISSGVYTAAMIIMIEISNKKKRMLSGVIFAYAIYMGELIFASIAMAVPHWKTLVRIIYSPTIVFVSYIFLLKESPRWLILNDKIDEVKQVLKTVATVNEVLIDEQELKEIGKDKLKQKFNIEKHETNEGFKDVITSREIMKRLMVAFITRIATSFVYYGLMMNSVFLPGSKYTNFLLITIMSFPGEFIALYFMSKIGRKLPLIIGFLTCGVLCMASGFAPESIVWLKIGIFLIGKMLISACYTGAITYSMELFPTSIRGSMLGLCAFGSGLGSMLAPLTPLLATILPALPELCFGVSSLISGVLLTLTPETKDLPLMDTVQQVQLYELRNIRNKQDKHGQENIGYDNNG